MKRAISLRGIGALTLLALVATAFSPRPVSAQVAPVAKLLPDNVYLYFSVPSVQELKARWNKTKLSEIRNDEAFKEFNAQVEEFLEKATREFETQTQMKVKDLLDIPSGEVAAAVVRPPGGKKMAVVGFLDFGKSEDVVDQLLSKLEDAMDKENADRKVQDFKNTRIVVYTLPNNIQEEGPLNVKPSFCYFVKDTMLVVSSEVSALESVLDNWGGKADRNFANNRIFQRIMEKCKTDNAKPVTEWFFDPIEMLKAGVAMAAEGDPNIQNVQLGMAFFLPLSGLNDFRGMGGTSDLAVDGYESVSKTMMYINQPPQGLLNLFLFPASDLTPPAWVGEKTQQYAAGSWDVESAYDAVEKMVDQFSGPGAFEKQINDLADQPPGIHVKKDIVDLLDGRFYFVNQGVEVENPEQLDKAIPKFLVSVGVRNTKDAQDLVTKLTKDQASIKTRNFRGETIMEVQNEDAKFAFSIFNNAVMITSDVSMLESVIRGDRAQKPLADSAVYQQITKTFPEKTSILSFQQTDEQIKQVYELLRKGEFGNSEVPEEAKTLFQKLPPFEALKKYLPIAAGYTVPVENGVFSTNVSQVVE